MRRKVNAGIPAAYLDKYNMYNIQGVANHGIYGSGLHKLFPDYSWDTRIQPCFTDEEVIEISKEFYVEQTQKKLDQGLRLGHDFTYIDVGQMDGGKFCACQNCMEYVALDGGDIGPMLHYANEIARTVSAEFGDELKVAMFAYWGTTSVPKVTVPEKNIIVSYCFYTDVDKAVCYNHPLDGSECVEGIVSNVKYGEELRGWCEIAETVNVWYYPSYWWNPEMTAPNTAQLRNDLKFFADYGVDGIYVCVDGYKMADEKIVPYLLSHLAWDADITAEEYEELIREYYMIMAGDGYEYLYEYHKRVEDYAASGCWTTMIWTDTGDRINLDEVSEGFLYDAELFGRANALAGCARQERFVSELSLSMYFTGLVASHSEWYLHGDEESAAKYEQLYNTFIEEATRQGYTLYPEEPDASVNLAELYKDEKAEWWIPYKYRTAE